MTEHPYDVRDCTQVLNCDQHGRVVSLRDRFAMAALQGLLAAGEASSPCILVDPKLSHSQKRCMTETEFAACCYSYADAMLKAREAQ